ncbi:MAG: hypothetical protein AAFU03_04860 [Bacteroidota bacterium]
MIRFLFRVAVLLVVGILGYNFFFGSTEEKAQSREIVGKAVDLGKDPWNLLKKEKEKFDEGKYDGAVDNLESLYNRLAETARTLRDGDALERIGELERVRSDIEDQLEDATPEEKERAGEQLKELTKETEELMNELEQKAQSQDPQ